MSDFQEDRRRFLRIGAVAVAGAAGAAVAGLPRPAKAWELEHYGSASPLALSIANRCKVNANHDALQAQLREELAKMPGRKSLTEMCPLCGCPVTVTR